jgi:ABC-type glycerol-3-phosphate transport system substrate-binding protein
MPCVGKKREDATPGIGPPKMFYRARLAAPAAAAAAALALLAGGCGSSVGSSAPGTGKVPLVLYAAEGYDSTVAKAFTRATGIPTSVYDAHTGIVVSKVYSAPGDELNAIKQGTIDVAVAQSSYGIGVGETQPSMKLTYPQFVTPVPSVLGIDARAPAAVQAEAKKFVQFVLSPAGQRAMQAGDPHGDSLYWPVLAGVASRPQVPSPATIPAKILDPSTWGAQENTIAQWFTSHIAA